MSTVTIPTATLLSAVSADTALGVTDLRVLATILAYTTPGQSIPLSQSGIAAMLRLHKPAVCRAFKALRTAGFITKPSRSHLFMLSEFSQPADITGS